jgi:hypothetical protein
MQRAGGVSRLFDLGPAPNLALRAVEGRESEPANREFSVSWSTVSGEYFEAMGVPFDVAALLDSSSWSTYQKLLTVLAALAIIFDGFDIQILGFAVPSLIREWHASRGDFGPVLAVGLAGMALGPFEIFPAASPGKEKGKRIKETLPGHNGTR